MEGALRSGARAAGQVQEMLRSTSVGT
jgi:monoamine oxidase